MADDALEIVRLRTNFYRDNYRRVVLMLFFMILINIGLVGTIVYMLTHKPPPQYFATTADGRIIPLYPLSQPSVSTAQLMQWVNEAATSAYSYSFVSYRKELQAASQYFTPNGWNQFQEGLKASRNLETVLAKKLVVTAEATGAPRLTEQGLLNGRYAWKVQIPLLVTYESTSERIQQPVTVNLLIIRIPTVDSATGIAIDQFVATERPIKSSPGA